MFEKPNRIAFSGMEYPLKCDMVVLEQVQNKYGDLIAFEGRIHRFVPETDAKGNPKKNKEGLVLGHYEYPDMSALMDFTYWCVCEGLEIEGRADEIPERKTLIRAIDKTPLELAEEMHAEYVKAFERKNGKTAQDQTGTEGR